MAGAASVFYIFPFPFSFFLFFSSFSFSLSLSSFLFFFKSTTIRTRFSRTQLPSYGSHIYRRIRLHTVHPCTPTHALPYLYMHPTIFPFFRHLFPWTTNRIISRNAFRLTRVKNSLFGKQVL